MTVGGTVDVNIKKVSRTNGSRAKNGGIRRKSHLLNLAYDEQTNTYSVYTRERVWRLPTHIDDNALTAQVLPCVSATI